MSHLRYSAFPGWGTMVRETLHYNQTVRIGDVLECSGQGGTRKNDKLVGGMNKEGTNLASLDINDVEGQYEQAFANVETMLKDAGSKGWSQVFSMRTYHVGWQDEHIEIMTRLMRQYMPDHCPIWTLVPVPALGSKNMRVEIEVKAHLGNGSA